MLILHRIHKNQEQYDKSGNCRSDLTAERNRENGGDDCDRIIHGNVKESMVAGNEVFLRGFGSFIIKRRAEKTARNISKNTTIKIPAHNIPAFKPAKAFLNAVKENK